MPATVRVLFLYYIEFYNIRKPRTYLKKPLLSVLLYLPEFTPRPKNQGSPEEVGEKNPRDKGEKLSRTEVSAMGWIFSIQHPNWGVKIPSASLR